MPFKTLDIEGLLRKQLADEEITATELRVLTRVTRIARDQGILLQTISASSARRSVQEQLRFKDAKTIRQFSKTIGERQGLGEFGHFKYYFRMRGGQRQHIGSMKIGGLIDPHEVYRELGMLATSRGMDPEDRVERLYRLLRPRASEETILHEGLHAIWFMEMGQEAKAPFIKAAREQLNIDKAFGGFRRLGPDIRALQEKSPVYARQIWRARRIESPELIDWIANEMFAHRGAAAAYNLEATYKLGRNPELDKAVRSYMKSPPRSPMTMVPEYTGADPFKDVMAGGDLGAARFKESTRLAHDTFIERHQGIRVPLANRAFNPIEGLRKGGIAEIHRRTITDFGSPFQRFASLFRRGLGFLGRMGRGVGSLFRRRTGAQVPREMLGKKVRLGTEQVAGYTQAEIRAFAQASRGMTPAEFARHMGVEWEHPLARQVGGGISVYTPEFLEIGTEMGGSGMYSWNLPRAVAEVERIGPGPKAHPSFAKAVSGVIQKRAGVQTPLTKPFTMEGLGTGVPSERYREARLAYYKTQAKGRAAIMQETGLSWQKLRPVLEQLERGEGPIAEQVAKSAIFHEAAEWRNILATQGTGTVRKGMAEYTARTGRTAVSPAELSLRQQGWTHELSVPQEELFAREAFGPESIEYKLLSIFRRESDPWYQGFTIPEANRAFQPIEGLAKGGVAEPARKVLTDFGSPYRRRNARIPLFMEQALDRSVFVDIETAGLDPAKRVPLSAATMGYLDDRAVTTHFEPEVSVRVPGGRKAVRLRDQAQFLRRMEPWPREMWRKHWQPERARFLASGGQLERPGAFFSELATKTADTGSILWAHNVHFDITGWASQHMSPEAMGKFFDASVLEPWYEMDPRRGKIYPTLTPQAWKYRARARDFPGTAPGAMRGFYGEFRATLEEAVRTGRPMVADSMMVAQSVLGMGQGAGYMPRTGDVFTGSGLEALHYAFFGKGYEAHLARADVEATRRLIDPLLTTAETLYAGAPLRGREARALYRLGAMQAGIAEANVERTFAQARLGILREGRYALRGERGRQIFTSDYKEILRIYEERFGRLSYPEMPSVKSIWSRVGLMEEAALDSMLMAEKQLPKLGVGQRIGAQVRFLKAEAEYLTGVRIPKPLMYGALAVGAVAGAAYLGRTPQEEDANTIPGLQKGGMAEYKRKIITDFGSGWRTWEWWKQLPERFKKISDWWRDREERGEFGLVGDSNMAYPAIDGFGEEGIASIIRKSSTDFGSGWRGLIHVPARWMASRGAASAEYLTKVGLAEHIATLKNELKLAESIAKMGAEMSGTLTEVEMIELRGAIETLKSASGRKQGAAILATEEVVAASKDPHGISRLKALIKEERYHEAVANSKWMRDVIGRPGAVPQEFLMAMEAQTYNAAADVRSGLRIMEEAEEASLKFSWREEYFAKMSAMRTAGPEAMNIDDFLALDDYANDRNFEILDLLEKRHRMGAMRQNVRERQLMRQRDTARMTVKTMERYAPLPISGVRMFDSPGVPGMVQRIHGSRKGSQKMYNH